MRLPARLRSRKFIAFIPIILVVLVYLLTASIRGYLIPFYDNTVYQPGVNQTFTTTFSPINQLLKGLGFTKTSVYADSCYNGLSDGGSYALYHGLHETVQCEKQTETNTINVTGQFNLSGQASAPRLQQLLAGSYWQYDATNKASDVASLASFYEDIPAISNNEAGEYGDDHGYNLTVGKTMCSFVINRSYYADGKQSVHTVQAYIDETCTRNVSLFGGSNG